MNSIGFGIVILLGLVAYQYGMRHFKMKRLQQAWEEAQDGLTRGDLDRAQTAAKRCVDLEPLFVPGRQVHAHVLALRGELDAAEAEYRLAADLQPRQGAGHFHLGLFYAKFRPERQEAALSALRNGVTHDPETKNMLAEHQDKFGALAEHPEFQAMLSS